VPGLARYAIAFDRHPTKERDMARKHSHSPARLAALVTLALGVSSTAFADDNSMSVLTGESYAYFNQLDYSAGHFNVARAAQAKPQDPVATTPKREPTRAERPLMLAAPPKGITLLSPFRDNTGA
jgi:hypothetical protein